MRLNKYLSKCGVASRRVADRMIEQGRINLNGKTVTELGVLIDPDRDQVEVDGKSVNLPPESVYIVLNKPNGYVTSLKDEFGRKTVTSLIKNVGQRVYPVGRLDLDTEGVLLLTNDGELAYRLTHPKYQVKKEYHVTVKGEFPLELVARFEEGIKLEDDFVATARGKLVTAQSKFSTLVLELTEGKKREIRRMCRMLGFPVHQLTRVKFADLTCKGMKVGTWRFLSRKEVEKLQKKVALA
ncbi:MAG: pseudouridine synthase [Candidatus Zixiibacteriota bacterium]